MSTFGIQASEFEPKIHVGRLNHAGNAFLGDKEDATSMAFRAVGEFARNHFDGEMVANYDDYDIEIVIRPKTPADPR